MYLVSPALPVGAYAYSQGQEYAVDAGWIESEEGVQQWIAGVLENSLAYLDLPVLLRSYQAWQKQDFIQINYWNDYTKASRETKELLLEDEQLGMALQRLLNSLSINTFQQMLDNTASFVTMFALAGVSWQIKLPALMQGYAWSWLENQVAAATKLVPLGQSQAQRILVVLMPRIPVAIALAKTLAEDDIGSGLPGLALASAKHERQYSRLFRS